MKTSIVEFSTATEKLCGLVYYYDLYRIKAWVGYNITIAVQCDYLWGGLAKPQSQFGHGWMIKSHYFICMRLVTHFLNSILD